MATCQCMEGVADALHHRRHIWVQRYQKLLEEGGNIVTKARAEARISEIEELMSDLDIPHEKSEF